MQLESNKIKFPKAQKKKQRTAAQHGLDEDCTGTSAAIAATSERKKARDFRNQFLSNQTDNTEQIYLKHKQLSKRKRKRKRFTNFYGTWRKLL